MPNNGPDHVVGVYASKAGKWEIKYVRGGKRKSEYRTTKESAERRAGVIQVELRGRPPSRERERSSAVVERENYRRAIWDTTVRVMENPEDEELRRTLRAISAAATAAAERIDVGAYLDRIANLERIVMRLTRQRRAGQNAVDPVRRSAT